ncbi:Sulfoacetaldehyde dehydrogenase [Micromonospora sp. MW-13]|uniref:aldehyde dehydrogenase family protein n=1 Tax=Micromonospora sp. MW-13 TaxID=2094022 RepID=UPI000E42F0E1|nr:aldehyde dehydrogenase family protein [Micromonospora sp. MW-13]RGC66799.1 Sulfoacetaldehyde dehydrogenase [Micromonospora sp. MW-13]
MTEPLPLWIAGTAVHGETTLEVRHPYDGRPVACTTYATDAQTERAVAAADAVRREAATLPIHVRAEALAATSRVLAERAEELARLITAESGKPVQWARAEVGRAVSVFRVAAESTRTWSGEVMRLDTDGSAEGRLAYVRRVPKGPVLAITPFNFPLNLVAHKVAPAIAVGAPVVVKPAPKTPLSALLLGEIIAAVGLPAGMVSVLNVPDDRVGTLVGDTRLPVVSFTGSGPVGAAIAASVPHKHVVLELGGNAAAYVSADYGGDADLDWAARRIATFANYQAGQSCIGVQRVYADAQVYEPLKERLVAAVAALRTGDPNDEQTQVGPLINREAAERVESWVADAVTAGARLLTGGTRTGTTYAPTILEDAPANARVVREEIFGPVLVLQRVDGADDAFRRINDSRFGLQAGVFTHDLQLAFRAHRDLEVGGVIIGDVPSFRADQMPYGGVKESGVGREGVRYAMADYTHERVMVLTGIDL